MRGDIDFAKNELQKILSEKNRQGYCERRRKERISSSVNVQTFSCLGGSVFWIHDGIVWLSSYTKRYVPD